MGRVLRRNSMSTIEDRPAYIEGRVYKHGRHRRLQER